MMLLAISLCVERKKNGRFLFLFFLFFMAKGPHGRHCYQGLIHFSLIGEQRIFKIIFFSHMEILEGSLRRVGPTVCIKSGALEGHANSMLIGTLQVI